MAKNARDAMMTVTAAAFRNPFEVSGTVSSFAHSSVMKYSSEGPSIISMNRISCRPYDSSARKSRTTHKSDCQEVKKLKAPGLLP